jgi:hypothetical protein
MSEIPPHGVTALCELLEVSRWSAGSVGNRTLVRRLGRFRLCVGSVQLDHVSRCGINPTEVVSSFAKGLVAAKLKACGLDVAARLFGTQYIKQMPELFTGIPGGVSIVGYNAGDYVCEIPTKVIELSVERLVPPEAKPLIFIEA